MKDRYFEAVLGCLLGSAVGDALGLPYEKLSRKRIYKYHTPIKGHALILNKGMFSDDTEHICMTAQSLIVSGGDPDKFAQELAWRLRMWLLGFPAGIGLATLRSCFRLWIGFSPQLSGVNSAGNGAAMRSAIIGVCYGEDRSKLLDLVRASTIITHNNHKAQLGAIAVAVAAYLASSQSSIQPPEYYQTLKEFLTAEGSSSQFELPAVPTGGAIQQFVPLEDPLFQDEELERETSAKISDAEITAFLYLIEQACLSAEQNESGVAFADRLSHDDGISGYIYDTVLIAIQVWLRNQDRYPEGIKEIIYLGGDTDTTAAILGGIIGASVGISGIPQHWLDNIIDFPRNIKWIRSVGKRLTLSCETKSPHPPLSIAFYLIPLRNFIFLLVILFHTFYRLLSL